MGWNTHGQTPLFLGFSVTGARKENKSKKIQSPSALFASAAQTFLVYHNPPTHVKEN